MLISTYTKNFEYFKKYYAVKGWGMYLTADGSGNKIFLFDNTQNIGVLQTIIGYHNRWVYRNLNF